MHEFNTRIPQQSELFNNNYSITRTSLKLIATEELLTYLNFWNFHSQNYFSLSKIISVFNNIKNVYVRIILI